ncbi:MAG TPA: O-antigen ligase family protein [Ignavibacteria bacterium]|nr:O-antigen ligase family protein [Ignavibacteria bacterium]
MKNNKYKILHIILSLSCLFGIILTQSRGVWLSLIVAIILMFINKPKKFIVLSVFLVLIFFAFSTIILDRVNSVLLFANDVSSLGRLQAWLATIILLKENYLTGYGFYTFSIYKDYVFDYYFVPVTNSHNTFLNLFFEMGVPASIIYLSFYFRSIYYCIRNMSKRMKKDENIHILLKTILLSILPFIIAFMFEPYFGFYGPINLALWLMIAIAFKINTDIKLTNQI